MIVLLTNCFMTRTLSVNKPSIILVRPQLPENIGMVARAMDNFGLNKLILVSPREKWPNKISIKSSANSQRIIKGVKIYKNLKSVLGNFDLVIATSNRKRFLNKPSIKNFDNIFDIFPKNKKICIMFGPENSGLSNEDLKCAQADVYGPEWPINYSDLEPYYSSLERLFNAFLRVVVACG